MTVPNNVLEISETNFIRTVSRNSVVLRWVALQICCFGNFRNTLRLKKLKRYGSPNVFWKLPKHCLFYGFMQNLFIEGHKLLLQKFPKQFLYCPRFLLKTVTKCAPEISETLFIKVVPDFSQRRSNNTALEIYETTFINKGCSRILLKTVAKCCVRNFRSSFYNDCLSARVMHNEQNEH